MTANNPDNVGGLPELPAFGIDTANHASVRIRGYTADQMRAYGELCRAAPAGGDELDTDALRGMWRALIDAGGATTVARHGVERGGVEWASTVTNGMLAIERHLHPERFDDFPAPASAHAGSGEVASIVTRIERILKDSEAGHVTGLGDTCEDALNSAIELLRKLQQGAE